MFNLIKKCITWFIFLWVSVMSLCFSLLSMEASYNQNLKVSGLLLIGTILSTFVCYFLLCKILIKDQGERQ